MPQCSYPGRSFGSESERDWVLVINALDGTITLREEGKDCIRFETIQPMFLDAHYRESLDEVGDVGSISFDPVGVY